MEETTLKAVIFDMDGVVLNTETISKQAFEQAFKSARQILMVKMVPQLVILMN